MNRQDSEKTKEQLIAELEVLRAQVLTLQQAASSQTLLSKAHELCRPEITEHKRAVGVITGNGSAQRPRTAEALRANEELFRSLSACSPVGIFLTDIEGRCTYTNPRCQAICGFTLEESLGVGWVQSVHPEDREWVFTQWFASTCEGQEYSDEFRFQTREGVVRWVHLRSAPMFSDRGELIGHVGTVEDISDRKQAQEELLISDAALQHMPDAILLTDLEGNILRWMGKAEQIFGYTAVEVIGKPASFLHRPDIRETMTTKMIQSIQETGGFCGEVACVRKDGSEVLIETTSTTVYDKTGNPLFFVGINRDLSEYKRAEAERAELIREQIARLEAEAAQQRSKFLAEVSTVLASSLDYENTLSNVANLAVPYLADWCSVDIIGENQSICRLAIAHRDPSKVELAWELDRRYPQEPNASRGVPKILRSGQAEITTEIPDEGLVAVAKDAEHLRLLRELGLRSCIVAPLIAQGRTLGAITFITAESGRRYGAADLSLAEDLAQRAAVALDNARLYREAQDAQQAAEEAADRTARLQAVTAALSESLTPPQVADVIVEQGMAVLGASSALVALLTESGTELEIVRAVGYAQDLIEPWRRFSVNTPVPLAEAVRTGEPIWAETTAERAARYPHLVESYSRYNFKAWISIPLSVQGRAIGGLSLAFTEPLELSQDERAFMLALTQQCSQAIERARLYEAEQTARNAAEAANRIKDEFLAVVSHELRTPLNSILGWSHMLRNRQLDKVTTVRAIEIIERNARSQNQLIDDLLDVSRLIRGKVTLNIQSIDLVSVIETAIETVRLTAEAKNLQLETQLDFSATLVLADSERLQQVIWNLLSNAIKFTPVGGRITLQLQRVGFQAQIQVIDTGIGIRADFLPHVFEYFRQADGTITRSHRGLGLGLAIVRQLVELHGGTVQAHSQGEGQGTTFTVKLPLLQEAGPEITTELTPSIPLGNQVIPDTNAEESDIHQPSSFLPLEGLRVLVVDDEVDALEFLSFMLQENGADVTVAASAEEALQIFKQLQPDVLVSDIGMPKEDGYTLIRKIRAWELEQVGRLSELSEATPLALAEQGEDQQRVSEVRQSPVQAIALTAYAREEDRQQAIKAGFQTHIPKPVEPDVLIAVVAQLAQ